MRAYSISLSTFTTPAAYMIFQGLDRCVESDLVAVLKAIGQGLFYPVDPHGHTIHLVYVDPFGKGLSGKPEDTDRRIIQAWRLRATRQRQVDFVRDLGSEFVISQRRDQTDDARRDFQGNRHQIRVAEGR